ncbi:hypothetical protein ACPA9J_24500 [Pseudomonas aeruginosa]
MPTYEMVLKASQLPSTPLDGAARHPRSPSASAGILRGPVQRRASAGPRAPRFHGHPRTGFKVTGC